MDNELMEKHTEDKEVKTKAPHLWRSWRLTIAVLGSMVMCTSFSSQASMTSAMVCMFKHDDDDHNDHNDRNHYQHRYNHHHNHTASINATITHDDYFGNISTSSGKDETRGAWKLSWDSETQGYVVSAFFLGYYLIQIPSGVLVTRLGPKSTLVIGLLASGVFHVLSIPAARWNNMGLLYFFRILAGLACGGMLPGTYALVANWCPVQETSFLLGIAGVGIELGNSMSFFLSLIGCQTDVQGGWPVVFYALGSIQVLMAGIIVLAVTDFPNSHNRIDPFEERYISENRPHADRPKSIPFGRVLLSPPVWAFLVAQLAIEWMYYTFITQGPIYLRDVIKLPHWKTNLLGSVPFLLTLPVALIAGRVSDYIIERKAVSRTSVMKINETYAKVLTAIPLLIMGFLPVHGWGLAFVAYTLMAVGMTGTYAGYMANPGDLSPAHAGFLAGLGQALTMWVAFVIPVITGHYVKEKDRQTWRIIFFIVVGMEAFSIVFYLLFGSGNLQPWSAPEEEKQDSVIPTTEQTPIISKDNISSKSDASLRKA